MLTQGCQKTDIELRQSVTLTTIGIIMTFRSPQQLPDNDKYHETEE